MITLPVPHSLVAVSCRLQHSVAPCKPGLREACHLPLLARPRQRLHRLRSQRSERQVVALTDSGANGILSLSPDSLSGLVLGGTKAGGRLIPQSYEPSSKFRVGNRRPQLQLNGPLRSIGPWAREPVGEPEAETPPGGQASPTGVGDHGNAATKPSLSRGPGR